MGIRSKEEVINGLINNCDSRLISDGYHTFAELYEHRHILFICITKLLHDKYYIWKSMLNADGSVIDGYFIMGINLEVGKQISYHIPLTLWNITEFAAKLDMAPEFDGHTSKDVLQRLIYFAKLES